jgi:hypothetical protein
MMDNTMISIREYRRTIRNGQKSREIGNIGHTRWKKPKQRHNTIYFFMYNNHWVDTTDGALLVPEKSIIHPVVNASALR